MIKVKLTDSERERLKNVSPQEKQEAFSATVKWVSGEMIHRGLSRDHGPLSDKAMCGKASVEIAKMAYAKVFGGEVHWKESHTLVTQMIDAAKSIMAHTIEEYYRKGRDKMRPMDDLSFKQKMDMEIAHQVEAEAELRDLAYDVARAAVKDHPKLLAYLDALKETDDYSAIRKRLKIPMREVTELERELFSFFK